MTRTRATTAAVVSGALCALAAGCYPNSIAALSFCGRMYEARGGHLLREGAATYHMVWMIGDIHYDSDDYGPVTAPVDEHGWACFHGNVGMTDPTITNFKLVSLTARMSEPETGQALEGPVSHLRTEYHETTELLEASGDFYLAPPAGTANIAAGTADAEAGPTLTLPR